MQRTLCVSGKNRTAVGRDALNNTFGECVVAKANEADCLANAEVQTREEGGYIFRVYNNYVGLGYIKIKTSISAHKCVEGQIEGGGNGNKARNARQTFAFSPRRDFAARYARLPDEAVLGDFLFAKDFFKMFPKRRKGRVRRVLYVQFFESEKIVERTAEAVRKHDCVFKIR